MQQKKRKKKKAVSCIPDNMDIIQTARELRELSVYLLGHFFVTLYNVSVLMRFLSVWSQYSLDSYVTILHTLSRENPLNNLVHYSAFMFTNSWGISESFTNSQETTVQTGQVHHHY